MVFWIEQSSLSSTSNPHAVGVYSIDAVIAVATTANSASNVMHTVFMMLVKITCLGTVA